MEIIEDILEKIENYLLKDEYIELSKLMSQSKYLKLWQIVYNLDGNVVFQLVNESLTRFGIQNHNELQDVINQCTSKSKVYQIMTSDCVIITRIFGMIYWINLLFGQFNQFVFQAKTQMSIIQYAFVQSIQKVFQPIGKKLSRAIIDHLFTLKNCPHAMNGRLNSNMRFILLFHDRTFTESTKVLQNKVTKKFMLQFEAKSRCNLSLEGMNIAQKAEKQNAMKINKYNEIVQKLIKQDRQLILGSGGDVSQESKDYGQDILFGYTKQINDLINTGNIYEESDENSYEDCVNWMKMKDSSASNQSIGLQILKVFVTRLKYQFESNKENSYASMITAIDSIEQEVFEWTHMIDYYFIKNSIQLAQFVQEKAILDYFPILLKNKDIGLHEAVQNHRFESLIRLFQFTCNDNQAISQLAQSLSEFTTEKLQDIEVSSAEIIKEYSMDRQNEDKIIQILQDTLTYDESLNVKQFQQKWWNKISELLDQLVKINDECFCKNNTIKVAFDGSFQQQLCHSDFYFDYFEDQCHLKLIEMKDKVEKDDSKQRQIEKQTIEGCNDNDNNNIDILLKLVPASERFLENYKKRLAIRLLHQLSNIQDEKDMLSKIEGIAGKGYFVKTMQNMIEDLDKNVVIRKDFIHSLEEEAEQDVEEEQEDEESKQEQDQGKVKENQKNDAVENKNSVEFHGEEKDYQDFIIDMKSIEGDIMNQQRDKNQTWNIFFSVFDSQEFPLFNSDCFQDSKEKSKESKIIQDREEEQNDSINLEIHNQDEMIQLEDQNTLILSKKQDKQKDMIVIDDNQIIKIEEGEEEEDQYQQYLNLKLKKLSQMNRIVVNIFSKKEWPFKGQSVNIRNMPLDLMQIYNKYTSAYLSEFKRRKLVLDHLNSSAEIAFKGTNKTLLVSNPTMIILLEFNSKTQLTAKDIQVSSGMQMSLIKQKIQLLLLRKIIKVVIKDSDNKQINNNDDNSSIEEEIIQEKKSKKIKRNNEKSYEFEDNQEEIFCVNNDFEESSKVMDSVIVYNGNNNVIDVDVLHSQEGYSDKLRGMIRGNRMEIEYADNNNNHNNNINNSQNTQDQLNSQQGEANSDAGKDSEVDSKVGGSVKRMIITAIILKIIKENKSMKKQDLIERSLESYNQNNSNKGEDGQNVLLKTIVTSVINGVIKEGYIEKEQDTDILKFAE